ncbi:MULTISPECIES: bestrophin-like domain [unclassified Streptosporangium]|uniref:bestrophin-like domain n=1 Tax=unclassified Streptosporangium TaxID=2632669 RepID=UPI0033B4AB3C
MGWVAVLVVLSVAILLIAFRVLRRKGRDDDGHGSSSIDFSANLALAVYLLVLAYAAVLCRDGLWATETDVQAEAESLTEMYWSVAPIPEAVPVRTQIRQYTAQSIDLDWPLMAGSEMSPLPGQTLADMRASVLRLQPIGDASKNLQQDALDRISEISHARTVRGDDASTGLESIFVISMILSGLLVIALPWTLRVRPTFPSIVADLVRVGVVVIGVCFIILISHPFSGPGAVGPDAFKAAQRQYDQIDGQFPAQP